MKTLVAKDQITLGLGRCTQLALAGMGYRMFRSGVTVAILALAVAFLVYMLTLGILSQHTRASAGAELGRTRDLGEVLTRWGQPDTEAAILAALVRGEPQRLGEYDLWSQAAPGELDEARGVALRLKSVENRLSRLSPAEHAVLLGDLPAQKLFERLGEPAELDRFIVQLGNLDVGLPMSADEFRKLVQEDRQRLSTWIERIRAGHADAVSALRSAYTGRSLDELVGEPPPVAVAILRAAGFSVLEQEVPALERFARHSKELGAVSRLVLNSDVRAALARATRRPVGEVSFDTVLEFVQGVQRCDWLSSVLTSADATLALGGPRVCELVGQARRERRLQGVLGPDTAPAEGALAFPARLRWLIALALLVCAVGVANAMLMSVTERFTEIATMKCLGATDGFVMLTFLAEAVIQGAVGGTLGAGLGVLLALVRAGFEYGTLLLGAFSTLGTVTLAVAASIGMGTLLAAFAAVWPTWIAARLAPMEAMRVD